MPTFAEPGSRRRTKRFARKEAPPGMRLTERDLVILDALARYRFLATPHIELIDGGSYASVMRVLRTLYDNGLVDLPRAQIADLIAHGSAPNAYALAARGARAWSDHTGGDIERLRWDLKNGRVKPLFISGPSPRFQVNPNASCGIASGGLATRRGERAQTSRMPSAIA